MISFRQLDRQLRFGGTAKALVYNDVIDMAPIPSVDTIGFGAFEVCLVATVEE